MVHFAVSVNGFSIFVLAVGWNNVRLHITQFSEDCPLTGEMPKPASAMETSAWDIPVSQDCAYLPFQDSSGPYIVNSPSAVCDMQDFTLEDQYHNSRLHLQDLLMIQDSQLTMFTKTLDLAYRICLFQA